VCAHRIRLLTIQSTVNEKDSDVDSITVAEYSTHSAPTTGHVQVAAAAAADGGL